VCTIQAKFWMDEQGMVIWVDDVWGPYTKDPRCDRRDTYLLKDEVSVHFMGSVKNQINKMGTELDIIPGGCTGSVQVLDTWVHQGGV
jgi:hypothetical protein